MKIALCNEVIAGREFAAQCVYAAELGYHGLEVAPYTLGERPHRLGRDTVVAARRAAADAGIEITGLHWLLVRPRGLSVTSDDPALRQKTREVIVRLVDLCAELGGSVLVHGSPGQRRLGDAATPERARANALSVWRAAAEAAAAAGVTYCIEPLAPRETDFINTVAEAARVVDEIDSPALRTMIDTSAAGLAEERPVAELIRRWLPGGSIAHLQLNDRNRRAPGQGEDDFVAVLGVLRELGYDRVLAIEPFDYVPDGAAAAARAIGYVRGILDALSRNPDSLALSR